MSLSKEQIALRRTGISASEIAAVCGLNPWAGPGDVWADKLGLREEWSGNEDTERGNELEQALVQWTGRRLGLFARANSETFRSKKDELALATPDGFALKKDWDQKEDPRVATIEVKAPSWRTARDWRDPAEAPDGCPRYYLVQAQWQAGVLGLPEAVVAGLVDGRLWVYRLPFSEALYAALLQRAKDFWAYVEAKDPPPFAPGQPTGWVADAYREQIDADIIMAPEDKLEDVVAAAQTYELARDANKKSKLDMDSAKGYLCALIAEHEGMRIPGYRATWKQAKGRTEVDWEAVAKRAMDALAGVVDLNTLDSWISEASKMKPGNRTFNLRSED